MQQSTSSLAARAFILSSFGGELTGEGTALAAAAVSPRGSEDARLAAHAQDLRHRPRLERDSRWRVRGDAVRRLRHRAEPPLAEMRLDPGEHAVDRDAGAAGPRRRTGRAATARPSPGGRRRRARPACRGDAAGSAGRRVRASAGRAASAASAGTRRRRTVPRRRSAAIPAATRRAAGSAAPTRRPRRARRRRRAIRLRPRGRTVRRTTPRPGREATTSAPPRRRARGSTARSPRPACRARCVIGTPFTRASIQVSAQPSAPWRQQPVRRSTPIP